MMEKKVYFKFYELFYRTIKKIPDEKFKAKAYESLCEYGLFGKRPDDPMIDALLTSAIESIDRSDELYEKKSDYMRGNQNAVKDWWKYQKQRISEKDRNEQKQTEKNTWKIEREEIEEREEISMCDTHTATAEEKEIKIRQTTATIKAERIWKLVLKHWNEKLWRNELRNGELTQRSYALDGVDLEQIDSLIDRFKRFKDKIEERKLQGLFYFNLNQWVLADFLKHINKFEWDFDTVTWKLAKQDCVKQAIKELLKK